MFHRAITIVLIYYLVTVHSDDVTDPNDITNSTLDLLTTPAAPVAPPRCVWGNVAKQALQIKNIKYYIILGIGIVGSGLSLLVNAPKMFKHSLSYYMTILAIFDLLTLITWTTRHQHRLNTTYAQWGDIGCKFIIFFGYFTRSFSINTLVMMTIERSLIVLFPLRLQSKGSVKTAAIILGMVALFFACFHAPLFHWAKEFHFNKIWQCVFLRYSWYASFDLVTTIFLPIIIIFFCNGIIIIRMKTVADMQEKITQDTRKQSRARAQFIQIMIQTLTVSVSFTILVLPLFIYQFPNSPVVATQYRKWTEPGSPERCWYEEMSFMFQEVATMLFMLNHAINGYLYCLFSRMFRQDLKRTLMRIFVPRRMKNRNNSSDTGISSLSVSSKQKSITTIT